MLTSGCRSRNHPVAASAHVDRGLEIRIEQVEIEIANHGRLDELSRTPTPRARRPIDQRAFRTGQRALVRADRSPRRQPCAPLRTNGAGWGTAGHSSRRCATSAAVPVKYGNW